MPTVIVTDVKYRMSVPALRDLSQRGWRVVCAEYDKTPHRQALGFYSRYCASQALLPWDESAFSGAVEELCRAQPQRPVLLPFGRRTLGLLSRNPQLNKWADFLVPTPEQLTLADNKYDVARLAQRIGVPAPHTASLVDFSDQPNPLAALADWAPLPCVVKYRNGESLGLHPVDRYCIVHTKEALTECYTDMHQRQENPLVQEYVEGEGIGVSVLMGRGGTLLDFICHRRLREYPVSGGPSSLCEAVFDRSALEHACTLLRAIGFIGVAMVEFKGGLDAPKLMEINPRFWGTSSLIAVSGSPFYETLLFAAQGRTQPLDSTSCLPRYKVGQKMRYTPQDFLTLPGYLRRRSDKLSFSLGFCRDLCDLRIKDGLFRMGDARPYFQYLSNAVRGAGQ